MSPQRTTRDWSDPSARSVVLVYPSTGIDVAGVSIFLPLSVWCLASALEAAGFSAQVIDMRVDRRWRETLGTAVRKRPLYVGISAMTGKQIHFGLIAAGIVRKIDAAMPIVWGGTHASVLPEETLRDARVDAVVVGQGEAPTVTLAERALAGSAVDIRGIFRDPSRDTGIRSVSPPPLEYDRMNVDEYLMPIVERVRGLAHVTSRGCPHQCGYCYNRAVHGARWTADPPEAVLDQLERISRRGVVGVLFFDDNFFVNRDRVEQIARGILDRHLKLVIKADCRADYLTRYSADFLALIKRAGFELLYIGAESGSDRMLEIMRKGVDVGGLLRANQRLAEVGIRPHYSFMAGLPGERIEDMQATVRLMTRIKEAHPLAYLSPVKAYVPYPGTDLFEAACAAGFTPPTSLDGWSVYDWSHRKSPWLSKAEARFVEKMAYVTTGLDPSIASLAGIDQSRFATWGFQRFSQLCRKRCLEPHLGFVPELPIVRMVKRFIGW